MHQEMSGPSAWRAPVGIQPDASNQHPGSDTDSDHVKHRKSRKSKHVRWRFEGGEGRLASEITKHELQSLYHLNAEEAASNLGIGLTALKNVCRGHDIPRWPYRRVKRIEQSAVKVLNGKCSKAEWQHLVEGVTDLAVPWDNPLWSNLCVKVQNAMSVGIHNNTASVSDTRRSFDTPRSSAWQGDSSGSPWESTPRPPMQYPESTDPFTPAVVPQHTVSGGRATSCASLDAPIGNLPGGSTSRDMAGRGSSFYSAFAGHPTPPPRVPSSPLAQAISNMRQTQETLISAWATTVQSNSTLLTQLMKVAPNGTMLLGPHPVPATPRASTALPSPFLPPSIPISSAASVPVPSGRMGASYESGGHHPMRRHSIAANQCGTGFTGPVLPPCAHGLTLNPGYQQHGFGSLSLPPDIRMDYERIRAMQHNRLGQNATKQQALSNPTLAQQVEADSARLAAYRRQQADAFTARSMEALHLQTPPQSGVCVPWNSPMMSVSGVQSTMTLGPQVSGGRAKQRASFDTTPLMEPSMMMHVSGESCSTPFAAERGGVFAMPSLEEWSPNAETLEPPDPLLNEKDVQRLRAADSFIETLDVALTEMVDGPGRCETPATNLATMWDDDIKE